MNNEFKKIDSSKETRYVLETTSGASSSASVASNPSAGFKNGFGVQSRKPGDNLLTQEADKKKVPAEKPRNFVAKNAKMGGAGAHKKKESDIPRKAKHKKPFMESNGNVVDTELSNIDPNDNGEEEGSFVKNQIHTMLRVLKHLEHAIGDEEDLPEWVQMKLSQAQETVVGVMNFMISDKERDVERQTGQDSLMKEYGVSEGAVKDLISDIKNLSDQEFQAKYHMTKAEARKQSTSAAGLKEMMAAPSGYDVIQSAEGTGQQEGYYEFTTVILNPNLNIDDENSPEEIDVRVTYDIEGSYQPATWGYHGGEPEEHPELNIMTVTDLDNGQEILDTLEVPVVDSLEEKAWEHYEQQEPDFDDSPDDDYDESINRNMFDPKFTHNLGYAFDKHDSEVKDLGIIEPDNFGKWAAINKLKKKRVNQDDEYQKKQRSVTENADVNREIAVLEKQLSNAEAGLRRAREITRQIKYDSVSMTIVSEITELAKSLGLEAGVKYGVGNVMEAERALEAAVYELEESFEDHVKDIRWKIDDLEDQVKYPQESLQEKMMPASMFAGSKKNKLGTAGQWRNKGSKKNSPAKAGDLVGGCAQESIDPYLNGLTLRLESAVRKGK